jgi:hypothetical protein
MDSSRPFSRDELLPYWNAAIYGFCLYFLGVGLLKSSLIGLLALVCVMLGYGSRWVLRGGVVVLVLTILVWIGVLPPTDQWHDAAMVMTSWLNQKVFAAP